MSYRIYCDGIWPFARQRFGKHHLKAGLAREADVHLLGNGSLVSAATDTRDQQTNCSVWWLLFGYLEVIKESFERHPCGGGVEYLHRDPASRRKRRKGKAQI
jgi:hypothetical protein